MPPIIQTDPQFRFVPKPAIPSGGAYPAPAPPPPGPTPTPPTSPSPLDQLVGTWRGTGFNTIWRPHFPASPQGRSLELKLTKETITFARIDCPIPNRGLLQADISMFGVTYLQQITDATDHAGLHVEPGLWAVVPQTTDPALPATVVRLASIPHGTVVLAQGTTVSASGGPTIPATNIIPFPIGGATPDDSQFSVAESEFPELNLAIASTFRIMPTEGVSQSMVEDPNSVLNAAIAGQKITNVTTLSASTTDAPVQGGGTANTAFLEAGNANATAMAATFWIETVERPDGSTSLQLQYSQSVMLDFNGIRWPVGTLVKEPTS